MHLGLYSQMRNVPLFCRLLECIGIYILEESVKRCMSLVIGLIIAFIKFVFFSLRSQIMRKFKFKSSFSKMSLNLHFLQQKFLLMHVHEHRLHECICEEEIERLIISSGELAISCSIVWANC